MKYTLNSSTAKQAAIAHIQGIDLAARPVQVVSVENFKKSRTNSQNSYLWGVVYKTISDETGYSCDELHELFKNSFLPHKLVTIGDKSVRITPSTTALKTDEFNEYIELVCRYAAETIGCYIPAPNEPLNVT